MSKSQKWNGLGHALKNKLEKKKFVSTSDKAPIFYQETQQNDADIKKMKMKSIIDQNSLSQFLQVAEMSQQNFQADRDLKFRQIREEIHHKRIISTNPNQLQAVKYMDQRILEKLQIPRRPDWKKMKNKEELQQAENEAYLNWRRSLATVEQQNLSITPYQKNLEVWRQLWRVMERSDLLIQIVDARDPLFFRCEDLQVYAGELSEQKRTMLLINKSDLVPETTRRQWNKYFIDHHIDHVFFSAMEAKSAIEAKQSNPSQNDHQTAETKQTEPAPKNKVLKINQPDILSVEDIIIFLNFQHGRFQKDKIQVGLVGYPNVGKSSVINTLFGKKKVGVANMPGKTKHFQTLFFSETVTLCDCPGLVFPRVSSSEVDMILNGLYPIDSIKKYEDATEIISLRIQKEFISKLYSLHWKQEEIYDGQSILTKYAQVKGFSTGNGLPNHSLAAKHILKDYVSGALPFAHSPEIKLTTPEDIKNGEEKVKKKEKETEVDLDKEFFEPKIELEQTTEDLIDELTEEDLLDIVEGKKVENFKITKQMRKNVKFAFKRGEDVEAIKKILKTEVVNQHKILIKV